MKAIWNQLIYFSYFQSFFLLCIYWFSPKTRKNINGYIAFLVVVLIIGLTGRILYISEIFGKDFRLIAFSEFSNLLFGATVYLFTRSSLQNKHFNSKDLVHYIPAVIYNVGIISIFMIQSDQVIGQIVKNGYLFTVIASFIGFALLFNVTYWIKSCQLFYQVKKELQNEASFAVKTQFFQNFLIAIGICLAVWVTVYFISIFGDQMTERTAREFIWVSIATIILFIAFYGIKEPQLFKITPLIATKKYAQSKLTTGDLDQLKNRLDQLMEKQKPYLNRKLLKAELAEMLGVSNPEIARLLNEKIGMNFFEYVNYYRIKEFVALAETEKIKNFTFFGLAQEAGFNSKTTFNKSFKKLMGASPKDYFNQQMTSSENS